MEIKKSFFFSPKLKKEYIKLYSSNNKLSVFQSYKINKRFFLLPQKTVHFLFNVFYNRKSKNAIYTLYDQDKPVLIALVSQEGSKIRILGSREGLEFTDLIHNVSNLSDYASYLNCLLLYFKNLGFKNLIWDFVPVNSVSSLYLNEHFEKASSLNYVNIKIPESKIYDSYYSTLSKHSRQNLRTAYNRAGKNSLSIEFRFFRAGDEEFRSAYNESMKIYVKRQKKRYGKNLLHSLQSKYFHFMTNLCSCESGAIACLYFNKKMVAFMQGYIDDKINSFQVPRLAFDDDYSFYSPGIILVNETVKYILENTELDFLDLARGDEQYKLDMGGEIYITDNYCIDLSKIQ